MHMLEEKFSNTGIYTSLALGFEVLRTSDACKTYNLLVDEGRHVVAAMIPSGK